MAILTGGNGSSREQAIIILNATSYYECVLSEYEYLEEVFGDEKIYQKFLFQEFIDDGENQYHLLIVEKIDCEDKEFWFDITDYFGRETGWEFNEN
jgi:hypothetical protein